MEERGLFFGLRFRGSKRLHFHLQHASLLHLQDGVAASFKLDYIARARALVDAPV